MSKTYREACDYVQTDHSSGRAQFDMLVAEGLTPRSTVLEIGCGALHLAGPLLAYLDAYHYYGIDPNRWLRDAARDEQPLLDALCLMRGARFSCASDFVFNQHTRFNAVVAHSVLSHVSVAQLGEFMRATHRALGNGGYVLASVNLHGETTADPTEWRYPGGVHFTWADIEATAQASGFATVEQRPAYKEMLTAVRPQETHDWIVLR